MNLRRIESESYAAYDPERGAWITWLVILALAGVVTLGLYGYKHDWFQGSGSIKGGVFDNYNAPFQYAVVKLTCLDHGISHEVVPDARGSFSFGRIHAGQWEARLYTWVGEYASAQQVILVKRNRTTRVEFDVSHKIIGEMKGQAYASWRRSVALYSQSYGGGGG